MNSCPFGVIAYVRFPCLFVFSIANPLESISFRYSVSIWWDRFARYIMWVGPASLSLLLIIRRISWIIATFPRFGFISLTPSKN